MRDTTPPLPAVDGAPLEALPEEEKRNAFASFPFETGHICAIKIGLFQQTKLIENLQNIVYFIFVLALSCTRNKWKLAVDSTDTTTYSLLNGLQTMSMVKN